MGSEFYCYSTGKVSNGILDWRGSVPKQCNRAFRSKQWLHLEVSIQNKKSTFKVDHSTIATWDNSMKSTGNGGIVLKNGWFKEDKQQILFKDLKVQ